MNKLQFILYIFIFWYNIFTIPQCSCQSNAQNIETFYPFGLPPIAIIPNTTDNQPPPSPKKPSEQPQAGLQVPPPHSKSSTKKAVVTAVVATAAGTIVISGLCFFLVTRYVRRRKNRVVANASFKNVNSIETHRGDDFVRVNGNLKGVIVDEEGLDVLYWRKLEGEEKVEKEKFNKDEFFDTEEEKKVISSKGEKIKKSKPPIQETHLLRGKSSSSSSHIWLDDEEKIYVKTVAKQDSLVQLSSRSPPPTPPTPPPLTVVSSSALSLPPPRQMKKTPATPPKTGHLATFMTPMPPSVQEKVNGEVKFKPLHSDNVNANVEHPIVWDKVNGHSLRVDGELMEALFGSVVTNRKSPPPTPPPAAVVSSSALPPPPPLKKTPAAPPPPPPKTGGSATFRPPPPLKKVTGNENGQVKFKPLHWDKVNANVEHSMVWDKVKGGSFRVDGELMEALFGTVVTNRKSPKKGSNMASPKGEKSGPPSQIFILDTRKSQNISIILRSLSVSRKEIVDALIEGKDLDIDILEKLNRIAPTKEEESDILAFDDDHTKLADAESFLYHVLKAVPSAFTRFDAMLFRSNYDSEILHLKQSLQILESGCKELKTRGLLLKLLEAVLKAGNRMNAGTSRGNAQAFNLNSLRKLSDVKSTDGKTTLLHFVVEEVVRAEGKRCVINRNYSHSSSSRNSKNSGGQIMDNSKPKEDKENEYIMLGLPIIGGISSQFSNVKKVAKLDYDALHKACAILSENIAEIRKLVGECAISGGGQGYIQEMKNFLDGAEAEIRVVKTEFTSIMELVKRTTEYYEAGASKNKGAQPLQIFVVVKDFLGMVDQVCIDITRNMQKRKSVSAINGSSSSSPAHKSSVKFPLLPTNFMSDKSKSSSSDSEDDNIM